MRYSIVTITFRNAIGLRATGDSVRAQTFRGFEWLVVDGGSTDGTVDYLKELPEGVASWTSEPDRGLYDAMNKGLERARGDYVIFLNAGDALAHESVLAQVSAAIDASPSPAAFVYGDSIDVYPTGEEYYRPSRSHRAVWRGMFTSHQSMFFRRDDIGTLRHSLALRYSADYDFVARFLRVHAARVVYVPVAVSRFDMSGQSVLHRRKALREDSLVRSAALGLTWPTVVALGIAHSVHHWLKQRAPSAARALRYRRR